MLIGGLSKTTLLDYPGRVAATIFTGGCNFRCPFCHNAGLVLIPSSAEMYSEEEVFSFLQKRKNVLQGVCITGGDYVAMDIKNSPQKYALTVGAEPEMEKIQESVELLKNSGTDYEFRTTVVKELHSPEDLCAIGKWIKGCSKYYLQQFTESGNLLGMQKGTVVSEGEVLPVNSGFHSYDKIEMEILAAEVQKILGDGCRVELRGVS